MTEADVVSRRAAARGGAARRGPKPAFSREAILECALQILDARGPDALSFRAVAAALSTSHQALYNYFDNLAELEDEVAARLIAHVRPLSSERRESLREQLVQYGLDLVRRFSLHPYLRQISGPACAAATGRLHNVNARALVDAGVDFPRAHACQLVLQVVASGIGIEAHRSRTMSRATSRAATSAYLRELSQGLADPAALRMAAGNERAAHRSMLEMIVDAHLPELR
jgi:AcrR family transcriptional regulator